MIDSTREIVMQKVLLQSCYQFILISMKINNNFIEQQCIDRHDDDRDDDK